MPPFLQEKPLPREPNKTHQICNQTKQQQHNLTQSPLLPEIKKKKTDSFRKYDDCCLPLKTPNPHHHHLKEKKTLTKILRATRFLSLKTGFLSLWKKALSFLWKRKTVCLSVGSGASFFQLGSIVQNRNQPQ